MEITLRTFVLFCTVRYKINLSQTSLFVNHHCLKLVNNSGCFFQTEYVIIFRKRYKKENEEKEHMDLKQRIEAYWDRRAATYDEMRRQHLHGPEFRFWYQELENHLPDGYLGILDIGTGTGFLAVVAASLGHRVELLEISYVRRPDRQMFRHRGFCVVLPAQPAFLHGKPSIWK